MPGIEAVLALLTVVIALALVAPRVGTPRPVVMATGGLLLALAGRGLHLLPPVVIPPRVVFFIFLPPLLASAGFEVPLGGLRRNARPIALLAVGLVIATQCVVAAIAHLALPGLGWGPAFVLGAIVAPPDTIAATSVAGPLGLPNRLVSVIQGEGLVNDATALVAYSIAIAVVTTGVFSWGAVAVQFVEAVVFGIGVGVVVAWVTTAVQRRIDDAVLETVITLLVPYVGYLLADRVHGSGVLAVVAIGLVLRERETKISGAPTRLTERTVWSTLVFLIDGLVFVLVGLTLGTLTTEGLSRRLVLAGALVSGGAIALRMAWMYVVPLVIRIVTLDRVRAGISSARARMVLGWAGMRGVISLAAALAIPARTASGAPFPARREIILLTVALIFVTLVLQGLTLVPLVRALGLYDPDAARREASFARGRAARAALRALDALRDAGKLTPEEHRRVRAEYAEQLQESEAHGAREPGADERAIERARAAALEAERATVLGLRDEGRISDDTARRLESRLDIETLRLRGEEREIGAA